MKNNLTNIQTNEISEETQTRLRCYAALLAQANERARLTGSSDPEILYGEHVADALQALPILPEDGRFIDVGTGGGLPGLVWGICRPKLSGTLLDSIGKKSALTAEIAQKLGCGNIAVVNARSEDFAKENRERFDIATARAVAHACILTEYLSPFVRVGGKIIAFKGKNVREELAIHPSKWRALGLSAPTTQPYALAGKERCLVIWEKIRPCPAHYPRKPGMAEKKPWCRLPGSPAKTDQTTG